MKLIYFSIKSYFRGIPLLPKYFALFLLLFVVSSFTMNQTEEGVAMLDKTFDRGEKISYSVHYGFVDAGEAVVEIDDTYHYVNGNSCYRVDVKGKTVGAFGWMAKVNDLWRSYIDRDTHIPQKFYRMIRENKYRKEEVVNFDHKNHTATVQSRKKEKDWKTEKYKIPNDVQDMISGYYFLRRVDYSTLKKNDIVSMDAFMEDTVYKFQVKYLGKESVKTELGRKKAYLMTPIMPDNKIFRGEDAITFWMSADEARIPLKIKAKLFIGAIEVDITDYQDGTQKK